MSQLLLGWRDKIQYYPEDPAHEANNRQFNSYIEKARKEPGPPAPPKFKVSLEKWLRIFPTEGWFLSIAENYPPLNKKYPFTELTIFLRTQVHI